MIDIGQDGPYYSKDHLGKPGFLNMAQRSLEITKPWPRMLES